MAENYTEFAKQQNLIKSKTPSVSSLPAYMTSSNTNTIKTLSTDATAAPASTSSIPTSVLVQSVASTKQNCDILLNNFQIKSKRYRVLLNYDHLVWERLDAKRNHENEKITKKEIEIETEQLSNKATYGKTSNVVHFNEIINIARGKKRSTTLLNATVAATVAMPQSADLSGTPTQNIEYEKSTGITTATTTATTANTAVESPPTEQFLSIHYADRIINTPTDCNRWHIRTVTLYNADPYVIRQWFLLLTKRLNTTTQRYRVRRLLVFINPYGGRQKGLQTYERYCKPIFQLAGIDASCIISQRSNQIRDILVGHDLTPYDAVCCVGGDGTAAEVINGLIFRAIRDLGMDPRRPAYVPKPCKPIGIIPAGSTDTVAYSMHGTSDATTAAIHLALGQRRGLDICSVSNSQGIIRFCASVLSYGYLGDVAAKSEKYRWMGTKRYEYTGVKAFLSNRGYEAEIRILQPNVDNDEEESNENITADNSLKSIICTANCQRCSIATNNSLPNKTRTDDYNNDDVDNDYTDDIPTSSNLSLYAAKSSDDNTTRTGVIITDNNMESVNMMTDCDRNTKDAMLKQQTQKENQIKKLLSVDRSCDNHNYHSDNSINNEYSNKKRKTVPMKEQDKFTNSNEHHSHDDDSDSHNDRSDKNKIVNKSIDDVAATTAGKQQWKTIKGEFFMICGANITCACSKSPNGISRFSHLGDGYLDLVLVRKTSILNNLRFVINTMGQNGDIRNLPFVEIYRTKKFLFRAPIHTNNDDNAENYGFRGSRQPIANAFPHNGDGSIDNGGDDSFSSWNCDGEVVQDLEISMSSHCQLIDVFMRGPHAYKKPSEDIDKSIFGFCL